MAETRKLAAILAADVAGYSKLAGSDEERTLGRLRALRSDLIDPTIAVHHGRVVKRTGDGVPIEFRSVVDAVRCAIEVQNGMVERNAGLRASHRVPRRHLSRRGTADRRTGRVMIKTRSGRKRTKFQKLDFNISQNCYARTLALCLQRFTHFVKIP